MIKAIGVQFNTTIKAYDFNPGTNQVKLGDLVLVETIQGKEVGKVVYVGKEIKDKDGEVKEIVKVLDEGEVERHIESEKQAREDLERVVKLVQRVNLPVRVLGVGYSIFEDRVDIFFSAEGRVDFRNAVRDLSKILSKTVRLRQVGTRDQAKLIGGFGPCGREYCCKTFLLNPGGPTKEDLEKSGIRNLSKSLGACGNIRCCLKYEMNKPKIFDKTKGSKGDKK